MSVFKKWFGKKKSNNSKQSQLGGRTQSAIYMRTDPDVDDLRKSNDLIGDLTLKTKKNTILPKMFAQQVIELEI